jgi:hypothetical protein
MFQSAGKRWHWPPRSTGKPTHTDRYLNLRSNHPLHVKRGLIQSLHNRASTICQEQQDLWNEIIGLRQDLQLSGYRQGFINSIINSRGSSHLNKEQKPLGSVYIPHVKGVSEKFKHVGNHYNIRTIFKTKHTLRSWLKKPGRKEMGNRWHSASVAFPVNVTEAMLAKQADL